MKPSPLYPHKTERLAAGMADVITEDHRKEGVLTTRALQNAIFNSANFSSIATDEKGVIQFYNVGAERMLGYAAAGPLYGEHTRRNSASIERRVRLVMEAGPRPDAFDRGCRLLLDIPATPRGINAEAR